MKLWRGKIQITCIFTGPDKCLAMPSFHAFTGCDNVSSFYGIGKNKALAALDKYPDAIQAFIDLGCGIIDTNQDHLFNFVQIMYSK